MPTESADALILESLELSKLQFARAQELVRIKAKMILVGIRRCRLSSTELPESKHLGWVVMVLRRLLVDSVFFGELQLLADLSGTRVIANADTSELLAWTRYLKICKYFKEQSRMRISHFIELLVSYQVSRLISLHHGIQVARIAWW